MDLPAGRILVVDDDENNRDMLSRRLASSGYQLSLAEDGPSALAIISHEPLDLVILDIEMPGMNGFEVLKIVRQTRAATQLPIIIATARNDRKDVVAALDLGANDFVTKPLDFAVVKARVRTQLSHKFAMDQIVRLEGDLRRRNDDLEKANARMRHSLELAGRMQQELLPQSPFLAPRIQFVFIYEPCDELGGDIFNVFPMSDSRYLGIYLLDVSGHGVPAALLSVTLSRLLTTVAGQPSLVEQQGEHGIEPRSPLHVAMELNARFQMSAASSSQYFTLFYGVLNTDRQTLRYVTAGHPPALHVPAEGRASFLNRASYAIGWFPEADYQEAELPLGPGDRLFIYSDGCSETMNSRHEQFGQERIADLFQRLRREPLALTVAAVMNTVKSFRGDGAVLDDISALSLEIAADD